MGIADVLTDELRREGHSTVRMLERVPGENLEWRPHAKSMTLGDLAFHLASIPHRAADMLRAGDFDILKARPPQRTSETDFIAEFRRNVDELSSLIASTGDEGLRETFTLRRGDHIILQFPKLGMVRTIAMNHSYHHRGQLSVYLRLLDVALPAIYGTSADEQA